MATVNLTQAEIEDLFREVVLTILNLPDTDNKTVRFPYGSTPQTGSAPSFKRTENVCFIYVLPGDNEDDYGQQAHFTYRDDGAKRLTEINQHTNVHRLNFVIYGPEAESWARAIKDGLVRQLIRERLGRSNFHLVSGQSKITRVPELINSEWWNRYDMTTLFYQYVRIEIEDSTGIIENVRISPVTERST